MKIDLSVNGKLKNNHLNIYRKHYKETQDLYINIIENISINNIENLSWWFSPPSSRHLDTTHIHHYLASLLFLEDIVAENRDLEILVETNEYKNIILKYFKNKNIKKIFVKRNLLINKIKNIFKVLMIFLENISYLTLSTILQRRQTIDGNLNLIHFDIHSKNDINSDRYFHFYKHFAKIKKDIAVTYTILPRYVDFNFSKYIKFIKQINISKNKCILFENILSPTDYLYILYKSLFPKHVIINNYNEFKFDIRELIKEEIVNLKSPRPTFNAYVYFEFIKKLSKKTNILRLLLWHENYIPEKGLLLSLSRYSKNTKSKGYQGFAPQNFLLNLFVTETEKQANITPNIISCISKKNLNVIKKYTRSQKYEISPSLRYELIHDHQINLPSSDNYKCFIYAPYDKEETINILQLIIKYNEYNKGGIVFNIKFHPGGPSKWLRIYNKIISNSNINIIKRASNITLSDCDLVIAGPSSVCIESIAMGKYVLVYDRKVGSFRSTITQDLSKDLYCIFSDFNELSSNLNRYIRNKRKINIVDFNKIKLDYFEKITEKNLHNFFYF